MNRNEKPVAKPAVKVTVKEPVKVKEVFYKVDPAEYGGLTVGTIVYLDDVANLATTNEASKPHPFKRLGVVKEKVDGEVSVI